MNILNLGSLERWISDPARQPACMIGLNLVPFGERLAGVDLGGSTLLGCTVDGAVASQAVRQGASLIVKATGLPFDPTQASVYITADLYDRYDPADSTGSWKRSFDYRCYEWFMDPVAQLPRELGAGGTVQARLHDTSIEAAVARLVAAKGRPLVGFMGGHDTPRTAPVYAMVAELARRLTRSRLMVLTGGGPGLMEAANLGAFLAPFPDEKLGETIAALAAAPDYKHADWLSTGWAVRDQLLAGRSLDPESESLGIPTWLYGHEPPNVFATHQAKMFYNSLREDGLVTLAGAGLVIGPGNAGTVQEIFQDATQNYYRKSGVAPTPIALLDEAFWSRPESAGPDPVGRRKPLRPLLMALAGERPATDWTSAVLFSDDVEKVADLLLGGGTMKMMAPGQTLGEIWRARLTS